MRRRNEETSPADITRILAGLPSSARTVVIDDARLSRVYEQAGIPSNTKRLYHSRLTLFLAWCAARGLCAIPVHPDVLRLYLVSLAAERKASSTLRVSLAAVVMAHEALGHPSPVFEGLRDIMRSLQETLGPRVRPTAISLDMLRQMVSRCGQDPFATRDRALILVTYFAGLRRAEAVGLNREEAHREEDGYRLALGRMTGPPRGAVRAHVPQGLALDAERDLCPVQALDQWLAMCAAWASGPGLPPGRGPLFVALHRGRRSKLFVGDRLNPKDLDRIVKRRAATAGLNAADLSAVDLRAGFYAEAAHRGALPEEISAHAKRRGTDRYLRSAEAGAPATSPWSLT